MDNGWTMDNGQESDNEESGGGGAVDAGALAYSRKPVGKGAGCFTIITDVENKDVCFNCLICLPDTTQVAKATHIHPGKGKGQTGVFSNNLATSGAVKHLRSKHGTRYHNQWWR